MDVSKSRFLGVGVAVAHGVFSGSLNILLKFLISNYHFNFLTLIQLLTSSTAALTLEVLRRLGKVAVPPFSLQLSKEFGPVCVLSTLQSTLTLWSLRGLSLPMYVVFKRCLPLCTLSIGVCVLRNGVPSAGVVVAVVITTGGAALAGAGDLTGDPFGYVTGVLAVIIHASYLVLIQKTSLDSEYGPLTAQYAIAIMASPVLLVCSLISMDTINMWSYEGWQDAHITVIFVCCVFIGCLMNFTTLHCTYINSAVTTSFVGVVKSIATITVGMLAFSDVSPTRLFVGGVAVNTVGSVTYCVVKYYETRKQSLYQDLEEAGKDLEEAGKDLEEAGKDLEEAGKDLEEAGKDLEEAGKDLEEAGKDLEEAGRDLEEAGRDLEEAGKDLEEAGKDLEEAGKDLEEAGKDLEEAGKDGAPAGGKPPLSGNVAGAGADPGPAMTEGGSKEAEAAANGEAWPGDGGVGPGDGGAGPNSRVMTEQEALEMQREHLHRDNAAAGPSLSDSYVGVWRSIRHLQFTKKDPLIDNMEQQSP